MKKINLLAIISLCLIILAARLFEHYFPQAPNFSPLASVILFSGVYALNKKYLALPLVALLISDFFIGFYHWPVMISVYGSFAIIALIGLLVKKHKNVLNVVSASLGASLIFFIVTNFAVWQFGNWYSHDLAGLMLCFSMAIPFFKNTLVSNLLYTGLLFGSYEAVKYFYQEKILVSNK